MQVHMHNTYIQTHTYRHTHIHTQTRTHKKTHTHNARSDIHIQLYRHICNILLLWSLVFISRLNRLKDNIAHSCFSQGIFYYKISRCIPSPRSCNLARREKVCVITTIYTKTHTCISTHRHTYRHTDIYTKTHTYTHTHTDTRTYTQKTHTHTYPYTETHIQTCVHINSSRVRQTPEEGQRTYRPKRCGNNNKDEDNSPKTLNDKNQQASSQKFRQLI